MNASVRSAVIAGAAIALSAVTGVVPASAGMLSGAALPTQTGLTVTSVVAAPSGFANGVTRLAGASRYETAIQVSKKYPAGVAAVYVATGTNFPDALSAAAAAAHVGGPLLLTSPTSLPAAVKSEIQRLRPAKIYVIGGTGAVSASVQAALASIAPVTRYGGTDRYDTGLRIVAGTFGTSSHAIIATGRSFPDALAATGVAGTLNAPVILVDGTKSSVTSGTITTLKNMGVTDVIIAGGAGVVSSSIEAQLRTKGYVVTRYGGADRFSTAALLNSTFFPKGSTDTMFLATGENFPDALAGAALAGRLGAPLYITSKACAPTPIRDSVNALAPSKTAVLGGTAVLSDTAARNSGCDPSAAPAAAVTVTAPRLTYPVFGSDGTVTSLARSMITQEQTIDVTSMQVPGGDILDTFAAVHDAMYEALTQNPYVFASGWRVTGGTAGVFVMPDYLYSADEAERRRMATATAVATIVTKPAVTSAVGARAKVTALHDEVLKAATYDFVALDEINAGATVKSSARVAQSQEAYGILVAGTAVCNGYAQALQLVVQAAGLQSVMVTGTANNGFTTGAHAWNWVLVDGTWLVVDATWDDATDALLGRDYLLLDKVDSKLSTRTSDNYWVVDANLGMY